MLRRGHDKVRESPGKAGVAGGPWKHHLGDGLSLSRQVQTDPRFGAWPLALGLPTPGLIFSSDIIAK